MVGIFLSVHTADFMQVGAGGALPGSLASVTFRDTSFPVGQRDHIGARLALYPTIQFLVCMDRLLQGQTAIPCDLLNLKSQQEQCGLVNQWPRLSPTANFEPTAF